MPKFKDKILEKNVCVHCDTMNKAIALLKWASKKGYKWSGDKRSYDSPRNNWESYQNNTCYYIESGTYGHIDHIGSNMKLISYEDAIERGPNA